MSVMYEDYQTLRTALYSSSLRNPIYHWHAEKRTTLSPRTRHVVYVCSCVCVCLCVCVCGGGQIRRCWLSGLARAGALHRPLSVMNFSSPPIGTSVLSVYRTERQQQKDVLEDAYI